MRRNRPSDSSTYYKRLPLSVLDDFPKAVLEPIESRTNADLKLLDELLKFDPASVQNPAQARLSLIERTGAAYSNTFPILYNSIAYSLYKTGDFGALETQARVALGNIQTEAARITKALEKDKEEAERILEEVRKAAAEQGVSQQAIYFQQSADRHDKEATAWQYWTVWVAIGVGVFAVASLFFHKISWLAPSDMYQTLQLGVSKVLVFAVLSFMLYLCARNMLSHKHNGIVDRHRQNALMTYKAIVDAAGDTPNREVILVQAAACIFSPQGTGYTRDSIPQPPGAHSVVEFAGQQIKGSPK